MRMAEDCNAHVCPTTTGTVHSVNLSTHAPKRSVILMPTAFTLDQIITNVPVKKDTKGMVKSAYPLTHAKQYTGTALHSLPFAYMMDQESPTVNARSIIQTLYLGKDAA